MGRRQRKRSDEGFSVAPFDCEAQAVLRPLHDEHIAKKRHEIQNFSDPNMPCKLYTTINLYYFVENPSSKNEAGPNVSKQEQEEGSREDFMV